MKTIEVRDEDYEVLMELSKELQLQENDYQAFPYYWEARSDKMVKSLNGEGEFFRIYLDGEVHDLDYFYEDEEIWANYLKEEYERDEYREYDELNDEESFKEYVLNNIKGTDEIWYEREQQCKANPSLFKSDVKNFIEYNSHHLGENPHTYANSIWRMPKMEALVKAIYRLNPQPKELVNRGCESIVWEKKCM